MHKKSQQQSVMMKIKVVYGVDMRLWKKYAAGDDGHQAKPDDATYTDLLAYIRETFSFAHNDEFRVTFKDDDDEFTTIASVEDLRDAFSLCQQQEKKSLKLHVANTAPALVPALKPSAENSHSYAHAQEEKDSNEGQQQQQANADDQKAAMASNLPKNTCDGGAAAADKKAEDDAQPQQPSQEEINAFLSDDLSIDLLSDLFVSVIEALQESQFEISFMECVQGVILSSDTKYLALTTNTVWPYFEQQLLPRHAMRFEAFLVPMMQMNAGVNAAAIKQWIPTMLNMMKMHMQRGGDVCRGVGAEVKRGCHGVGAELKRGFRGWHRGRGWPWRGGGGGHPHHPPHHPSHPHHPPGHPVPPFAHHGDTDHPAPWCGPSRGWKSRGGRGRDWRSRARGGGRGGQQCAWQQRENRDVESNMEEQQQQPQNGQFAYTEEMVAIMNMGFGDVAEIKRLLVLHKGSKENVVQTLISNSKK